MTNHPGVTGARYAAAERRFERYLQEMREWGLTVVVTGDLVAPPQTRVPRPRQYRK